MEYILYNGKFVPVDTPVLMPDNRSFRYGEGLFETMRKTTGGIALWERHLTRLHNGMEILDISFPPHVQADTFLKEIDKLVQKNRIDSDVRIRLTCFKGDGALWEEADSLHYLVQCWNLPRAEFNLNGLDIGVFTGGAKSCDALSNLKSNNYLLYSLAAQYGKKQRWNDCLVLNQHGRLADSTIANIFFIKDGVIYTPALSEASVAGVMRGYLIDQLPAIGFRVQEGAYSAADLANADEVFLSNAIHGIRWVKRMDQALYGNHITAEIYHQVVRPLFQ